MHVPLKSGRTIIRRTTSPQITPPDASADVPSSPTYIPAASSYATLTPSSVRSPIFKVADSDGAVQEEDDSGAVSSESEYIFSDPTGFRSPELSPERKVQFVVGSQIDDIPEDDTKESEVSTPASVDKLKKHKKRLVYRIFFIWGAI